MGNSLYELERKGPKYEQLADKTLIKLLAEIFFLTPGEHE